MEVVIRQARRQDSQSIAGIYGPYVRDTPISFEEIPPTPGEMERRIVETLERFPYLVAEEGDCVVGYAYATSHRVRASYRWSVDVAVYTAGSHQRLGIGRLLYGQLLPQLEGQGFAMAYAGITVPNPASEGLHESLGFKRVGMYGGVGYKLGKWRDVGWWELPLAKSPTTAPREPTPWPLMPAFKTVKCEVKKPV